jgi:hypothetical protein
MAPVRLIADPTGFVPLVPMGFGWRPGAPVTIRLVIVNDDPAIAGEARVRWAVARERGPETAGVGKLRDAVRRKTFSGDVACRMPLLSEPALHVTTISLPIDAEGDYGLDAELLGSSGTMATAALEFTVAASLPDRRERPLLPDFLAVRLVEPGSLEVAPSSLRFALRNRTRPAVLTGLRDLRLDGVLLAGARLLVETPSGRVPLPRRLELPLDRPVRVVVEIDPATPPKNGPADGVLEVDLTVPGVAGGRVRVSGSP